MKITGYRLLRSYHDWGRPIGDVNGFIDSGHHRGADRDRGDRRGHRGHRHRFAREHRPGLPGHPRTRPPRRLDAVRPDARARLQGRSHRLRPSAASERSTPPCGTSRRRSPGNRCGDSSARPTVSSRATPRGSTSPSTTRSSRLVPHHGRARIQQRKAEGRPRRGMVTSDVSGSSPTRSRQRDRPALMLDANESWNLKQAVRYVSASRNVHDLTWIEEPLRRWDAVGQARLGRRCAPASPPART